MATVANSWRLVVICGTVFLCWLVGWLAYFDFRKKQLMFEERRAAIENGMTPPPLPPKQLDGWPGMKQREAELKAEERRLRIEKGLPVVDEQPELKTRSYYLRRGLVAACLGVGFVLAYWGLVFSKSSVDGVSEAQAWAIGLAPLFLLYGVANLIYQRYVPAASPATDAVKHG
jgi:hypothetical protein